jgi:probable rRNA maturation factor
MDELQLLTTHGILHLLGFDHADAEEEKEMFALQRDLLIGFAMNEKHSGA